MLSEYLLKDRLARHPGGRYSYSNTGYEILSAIIEEQTGKSYEDYCGAAVFGALGGALARHLRKTTTLSLALLDSERHEARLQALATELGAASVKDMGRMMAALKERFAGKMDFGKASGKIKELLNKK